MPKELQLEVNEYTEYSTQTSFGSVTVQVPKSPVIPVQIIVDHGSKKLILTVEDWDESAGIISEALKREGWEIADRTIDKK